MRSIDLSKIEAVIADMDGTAVPVGGATASQRLHDAIAEAKRVGILVTFATGRSFRMARQIFEQLEHDELSVISAGTEVIDSKTGEVKWGLKLSEQQVQDILEMLRDDDPEVHTVNQSVGDIKKLSEKEITGPQQTIFVMGADPELAEKIDREVARIDDVAAHSTTPWGGKGRDVHLTHKDANKEHTVKELMALYDLDPSVVAGVGDSGNDLPLMNAVGIKVAVENADSKLKEVADIVVDSVDDDGLAKFIESVVAARAA